ncbi:Cys-tRNA(Pro) deacylase [Nocardioides lentus]|uniref:Cys-tRNA(Pro)/Cys-tRNA(Cys) deacylase n=1 Tax=Nocardioides lentus TaxID=338077 RepID=A0ABN2P5N9_9ACTN
MAAEAAGVRVVAHAYAHDPRAASYGEEAAQVLAERLGVEPARVLKTLVVRVGPGPSGLAVAVVPVTARLDLKAAARALGAPRAAMAERRDAERSTGYVLGGISPLGQRRPLPTALDSPALDHPTVFVSGGRRGLDLEIAPADLVRLTDAVVAPLARP